MSAAVSSPEALADTQPAPEPAKRHLPVLSNSEIRTFRRCAREHHFAYRLRRRPKEKAAALRFGTLLHKSLEAWWRHEGTAAGRFEAAIVALRAAGESNPFDLVRAEELMLGYTARWGEEDFAVVSVEEQFDAPLVNPATGAESRTFRLGGKLDVVVARGSRKSLMEHKSSSEDISDGAKYWQRVSALDSQISTYMNGARELGHDVQDAVYDVIRKLALRPKEATPVEKRKYLVKTGELYKDQRLEDETPEEFRLRCREAISENPDKYYARGTIVRLEADERDHAFDTWQFARLIREAEVEKRYPRNPDACVRYGRNCDYFPVCSGEASIEDDNLYRTAETAHEELAVEEIYTT